MGHCVHLLAVMAHNRTSDIKIRVRAEVRDRLEAEAKARDLAISDIVREALREYLRPKTVSIEVDAQAQAVSQ
jgi:post-segregation antitoxin (ccd killing protein)